MKPGVQKPHWMAASSMKACWMSLSSPPGPISPSRVRMFFPSAQAARYRQELKHSPSMRTLQAPHSPTSQPFFTLVRRKSLRSMSVREARTSTIFSTALPLMVQRISLYWLFMRSHLPPV